MLFSHLDDAARTASIHLESAADGTQVAVVEHAAANGKVRKKSFKKKTTPPEWARRSVHDSALRFLLREGFILRAPQPGPVAWLTHTAEPYPHGYPFTVDPTTGRVWVADTGNLRCIEPGTCAQVDVPIGDGVMPRAIACGTGGHLYALLDIEAGAGDGPVGTPPWRKPSRGALSYALVRVSDGTTTPVATVPFQPLAAIFERLSVTDDGRVLGPHVEGAALYAPDGTVLHTFTAARTNHDPPKAAVSPSGALVATTTEAGAIRIIQLGTGEQKQVDARFAQAHGVEVDDDGTVWVRGFAEPSGWGHYRLEAPDRVTRVSEDFYATVAPDRRTLVEVGYGTVTLRPVADANERRPALRQSALPVLGMARHGRAHFTGPDAVVVRTDVHTLAGVDLSQLGPPKAPAADDA